MRIGVLATAAGLTAKTDAGARVAGSPSELAAQCDIVQVIVRTESQVTDVLFGEPDGGVIGNARPGTIVLLYSTIPPRSCRKAAEVAARKSIRVIDAPVAGGPVHRRLSRLSLARPPGRWSVR